MESSAEEPSDITAAAAATTSTNGAEGSKRVCDRCIRYVVLILISTRYAY